MPSLNKTGNWSVVKMLIKALAPELKRSRDIAVARMAMKAERISKEHISNQDLNWPPLAPSTIAKKQRADRSTLTLVETSEYFNAITSYVKSGVGYSGVRRSIAYNNGQEIAYIAKIHEYGTSTIPKRELWKPTFDETLLWGKKNANPAKIFIERIRRLAP